MVVFRRFERMPTRLCFGERPAAEGVGAEDGSHRLDSSVEVFSSAFRLKPAAWSRSERLTGVLTGVTLKAKRGALDNCEESKSKFLAFFEDAEKNWAGSMFSASVSSNSGGAGRLTAPQGVAGRANQEQSVTVCGTLGHHPIIFVRRIITMVS